MANVEQVRRVILKQVPLQFGPVKLNFKLAWAALVVLVGFMFIVAGTAAGAAVVGVGMAVLLVVLYLVGFAVQPFDNMQTTAVAKAYRVANHKLSQGTFTADDMVEGEIFGIDDKNVRRPKPIRQIGRMDFIAHQPQNVQVEEGQPPPAPLGVVRDRRYDTYTSLLWWRGSSLLSANDSSREGLLNHFARLLDDMAPGDSPLHRFAWRFQTILNEQQYPEKTLSELRKAANLSRTSAPNEQHLIDWFDEMGGESLEHRTTMSLTIRGSQVKREAKSMGSVEEVLLRYGWDFYNALMGVGLGFSPVGVKAARLMSYNELVIENRLSLDPVFGQPLWEQWQGPQDDYDLLSEHVAWPKYANFTQDDYCQLGLTYHKGFYIAEFPRSGMFSDQFWNLLRVPIPKTVTAVFNMIDPKHAQRRAEFASAGATGRIVDRQEARKLVTQAQQVSVELTTGHEGEVARNIGQVGQVTVYIDVTGASLEEVNSNADRLRSAWSGSRFLVEPLKGMQAKGIEALLPAGRGLRDYEPPSWI